MTITSFGPANRIARTAETHPLTWRLRDDGEPVWLDEYQAKDGYAAARKALTQQAPDDIVQSVKDSGLKGRGGAGFPTGVKWGLMPKDESMNIRYLLCNADEMEPNTWKDRMLMEQLPHLLVEGMLISARALKAYRGYIFLRGEYVTAARHLNRAVAEAKAAGLLGKNILGTGFDFELFVHTGAGRYICGEETALINSLEGRRANPRSKPPFPAAVGVWGKPTCVNNVETLCNVPAIVNNGNDWYKSLAREGSEDHGTKLMGFSGKVKNPGLWELPFGVQARELFEDYAGGMRDGFKLKCWQPGGAGTGFLLPEHLDAQMYAGGIAKVGTRMGTGLAMAVDDSVNMVSLLRNMEEFFAQESCGFCTPCRDGLPWSVKMLRAIEKGQGQPGDIETLLGLVNFLGPGKTFCAHAPGAVEPLGSAIKYFRSEFEAGIAPASATTLVPGKSPTVVGA
ncbi:NADH dehydrogenase [Pseudomonas amygdali pv. tabaci str. ATCC 11528]|uniref:NADH-quinone oxidoreductase subunit F n=2 Tax=Pseudomonas amygdali pv. lachrymans TaxID=53707 RepID=A0ABR5L1E0_PSEAV|nr:NADH-quinone oxidoreductase subunit NuoF [Pseudomonas amygdali]ARA80713.1 NADH-quinone oxidoreductase subunit F [Pseudomonas amygdali pv. lachrymans]AXH56136.1 NADH-quinone oxidoreductase subunit NuoF [Pseudomonas amygdali pv. lachrymans str. M301315]KEZ66306.1 NADH dehydrogenase [Pseudomonas amygdali pv. tabaci str. ATCC 11528]KKY50143.1 NADH dehydrogenase [Pseudomonas amygdali pv. tabaci str. ATCC 11528]KPC22268.1 NADH dehydrogenase I subunit F [Pseudomonas amygdali pv. lachrymans]